MQEFESEADVHLARFPAAEERYRAITTRISEGVDQERQLAGNPRAAVARSQFVVAVSQASIETDQLHNSVESLRSSLQINVQPITKQAGDLEQGCHGAIPQQIESITSACERLFEADVLYRQKFESVERGLSQLEETYVTQRKAQEALLRVAEQYQ